MTQKKKKVVIWAYYFPPYAGVSGIRSAKFFKYLPHFGWNVEVLAIHPKHYRNQVSKFGTPPPQSRCKTITYIAPRLARIPILVKLLYPIIALFISARQRKKIDAVYMSGSPFHPFLMTLVLSGVFRIPTVLDFRDSWSQNDGFDGKTSSTVLAKIRRNLFSAFERLSIRFASRVVFATSVLKDEYETAFPSLKHKYQTIRNGFDQEDFNDVVPKRSFSKNTLILAGKFYTYTPEAVGQLMSCLQNLEDVCFVYVGEEAEIIRKRATEAGVGNRVEAIPYQPYAEVLRLIAGADVALMTNGMKNGLGTKLFDYLALGKPTICMVPRDSVVSREFGHAANVLISEAPHSTQEISELLLKAFRKSTNGPVDSISEFTRSRSAQTLGHILDEISQ